MNGTSTPRRRLPVAVLLGAAVATGILASSAEVILLRLLRLETLPAGSPVMPVEASRIRDLETLVDPEFTSLGPYEGLVPATPVEPDPWKRALRLLRWLRATARKVGDEAPSNGTGPVFAAMHEGKGVICSHMALMYQALLRRAQIRSRYVRIGRSITDDLDVHDAVEILLPSGWALVDPTFGIAFIVGGRPLGLFELRQIALVGHDLPVPTHLADAAYPAQIDTYYIDYDALIRNAFVRTWITQGRWWTKIPGIRYYYGDRFLYPHDPARPRFVLYRWLVWAEHFLFPPLAGLSAVLALLCVRRLRRMSEVAP